MAEEKGLSAATDQVLSDKTVKNLIYGEAVHADNRFLSQFAAPEHLDTLKRNGVSEIAMELPKFLQPSVDSLTRGSMTADDFKKAMKFQFRFFDMDQETSNQRYDLITDMIVNAQARGINVQFVDDLAGTAAIAKIKSPAAQAKIEKCVDAQFSAMTATDLEAMAKDVMKSLNVRVQCVAENPELRALAESIDNTRLKSDARMGAEAAARNPDGRTAFFYGTAHAAGIASGYTGKSAGIAGTFPENTDGVRTLTPFFRTHYDIESGTISTPISQSRPAVAPSHRLEPTPA